MDTIFVRPAPITLVNVLSCEPADQRAVLALIRNTIGDFDVVRAMLSHDVRLDLVPKFTREGRSEVGEYYGRYAACAQSTFEVGCVEGIRMQRARPR